MKAEIAGAYRQIHIAPMLKIGGKNMAISTEASILNILKVWYKDGVENLLFRNSPLLKEISKTRVEGKSQNFAALYGRGGAVSADFLVAQAKAAKTARNAEFSVVPGDLFSVYSMNAKEVQASLSKRGAYMKVAGNKLFAATEAFRKTLAASLYGRGYGEIAYLDATALSFTANTAADITLSDDAIIKIDVDSVLALKEGTEATTVKTKLTVNSINGNTVNVTPDTSYTPGAGVSQVVLCIDGSMDANGNAKLPMGLDGWLPIVATRSGADWNTHITKTFFGVNRSVASDRLAGSFYVPAASESKAKSVQELIRKVRRQGSQADFIVMNDEDWLAVSQALETTNSYFTQTSEKGKKTFVAGASDMAFGFSTSWVDNVYDDPYCPKGKFYVLDKSGVEYWTYTNVDKVSDGVANNNPGKQSVESMEGEANEGKPYGLIIDDFLTVQSGTATSDGPSVEITLNFFGSLVVTNPSIQGVGLFYNASGYTDVLGYN